MPGIVVVLPAYNAERTLERTVREIPRGFASAIILVDDGSKDRTIEVAGRLGLTVFAHERNLGYGANQKTCYREALRLKPDIVLMLHPDYQYDPKALPELVEPIQRGEADIVLGSRFLSGLPLASGMPLWKILGNRLLTALENLCLGLSLSEFHTGLRAYRASVLKRIRWGLNSNSFLFDQEIIVQTRVLRGRIAEIPVEARYLSESSSIGFWESLLYSAGILRLLLRYLLFRCGVLRPVQFMAEKP